MKFYVNITPSDGGKPVRFSLSRRLLIRLVTGLISAGALSSVAVLMLSLFALKGAAVSSPSAENLRLKGSLEETQQKLALAQEGMERLFAEDLKLRTALGLDYPSPDLKQAGLGGFIGKTPMETDGAGGALFDLSSRADRLSRFLALEFESFGEISEKYTEDSTTFATLPSIPPAKGFFVSGMGYRKDPITGGWKFHAGVDIVAPSGTPVCATADGTIRFAGWRNGYGLVVEIEHQNGLVTRYAHNSKLAVTPGMSIERGEVISYVGSTGRSIGPHCHYEVLKNGVPTNPMSYIVVGDVLYD